MKKILTPSSFLLNIVDTTNGIRTINKAIEVFSNLTCVKWQPLSTADQTSLGHQSYVKFYSGGQVLFYLTLDSDLVCIVCAFILYVYLFFFNP